jgi:nucleotide-binding universal stress UspA family protein
MQSMTDAPTGTRAGPASPLTALIVPMDMTDLGDRALPVAGALARRAGLTVHLVATMSPNLDQGETRYELARRAGRLDGCRVETAVLASNDPVTALAGFARQHPGALVCMATHAHSALAQAFVGSVADDLLQHHSGPMLLVGPSVDTQGWSGGHLLVCLDDRTEPSVILDMASTWHATFDGAVELLEAVDHPPAPGAALTPSLQAVAAGVRDAKVTSVAASDPVRAIVGAATHDSVVVVASRRQHRLRRALLGGVTWEVLRRSPAPVLVTPARREAPEDVTFDPTSRWQTSR